MDYNNYINNIIIIIINKYAILIFLLDQQFARGIHRDTDQWIILALKCSRVIIPFPFPFAARFLAMESQRNPSATRDNKKLGSKPVDTILNYDFIRIESFNLRFNVPVVIERVSNNKYNAGRSNP